MSKNVCRGWILYILEDQPLTTRSLLRPMLTTPGLGVRPYAQYVVTIRNLSPVPHVRSDLASKCERCTPGDECRFGADMTDCSSCATASQTTISNFPSFKLFLVNEQYLVGARARRAAACLRSSDNIDTDTTAKHALIALVNPKSSLLNFGPSHSAASLPIHGHTTR